MADRLRIWGWRICGIAVCLFCVGCVDDPQEVRFETLSPTQYYEMATVVIVAEANSPDGVKQSPDLKKKGTEGKKPGPAVETKWKIVRVVKDPSGDLHVGAEFTKPMLHPDRLGKRYILLGFSDEVAIDDLLVIADFTPEMLDFLQGFPKNTQKERFAETETLSTDQASHLVRYLEHSEAAIAKDAHERLNVAAPKVMASVANEFPRKKLVKWVSDPATKPDRRGLYWLMLGMCGRREDLPLFEKRLKGPETKSDEEELELAQAIAGYVLLTREAGIKKLEETLLTPKSSKSTVDATVRGLSLAHDHAGRVPVPQAALNHAVGLLLDRPEFAAEAIRYLTEWKDWTVQERLAKQFEVAAQKASKKNLIFNNDEHHGLLASIISYMRASVADCPSRAKELPPHVQRGQTFLKEIDRKYPDLMTQLQPLLF